MNVCYDGICTLYIIYIIITMHGYTQTASELLAGYSKPMSPSEQQLLNRFHRVDSSGRSDFPVRAVGVVESSTGPLALYPERFG